MYYTDEGVNASRKIFPEWKNAESLTVMYVDRPEKGGNTNEDSTDLQFSD